MSLYLASGFVMWWPRTGREPDANVWLLPLRCTGRSCPGQSDGPIRSKSPQDLCRLLVSPTSLLPRDV